MLLERLKQKYRTLDWPDKQPTLSLRYRGKPKIQDGVCKSCKLCYSVCPTNALIKRDDSPDSTPAIDLGKCIFCGACTICPNHYIEFTSDYHMAARSRNGLIIKPLGNDEANEREKSNHANLKLFRRSFKLRQVSAGGCNACEADCNVLGTLVYDLGRFGCEFTASPRHADSLALTGPISNNMLAALADTWAAIPTPKFLLAVGACAISGGVFSGCECVGGMDGILANKDLQDKFPDISALIYVPGCPPNPWTILDGILSLRSHA